MTRTLAPEAAELVRLSKSPNTRRSYRSALKAFKAWLDGREQKGAAITDYLGHLDALKRSCSSANMLVAALRSLAGSQGLPDPLGPLSKAALGGFRRRAVGRGRGQSDPLTADAVAAILSTACLPRIRGLGKETEATATRRGMVDRAIAALLFHGGLRRSEAAALTWSSVSEAPASLRLS